MACRSVFASKLAAENTSAEVVKVLKNVLSVMNGLGRLLLRPPIILLIGPLPAPGRMFRDSNPAKHPASYMSAPTNGSESVGISSESCAAM